MRHTIIPMSLLIVLCLTGIVSHASSTSSERKIPYSGTGNISVVFTENRGQWPDSILFRADASGSTMWFTADGIYYQFTRMPRSNLLNLDTESSSDKLASARNEVAETRGAEKMLIKAQFENCSPSPTVHAEGMLDSRCNFLLGNDKSNLHINVANYTAIVVEEIYPGIDIRYFGDASGRVMYKYISEPGTDPSHVRLTYEGAEATCSSEGGTTHVRTKWGTDVYLIGSSPSQAGVASAQVCLDSDDSLGVANLMSNWFTSTALQLVFSTYLGGTGADPETVSDIAVDAWGYAYVTGTTYSADFPSENPLQPLPGGNGDVFVTKLSGTGQSLIYSTFLGGSLYDRAAAIAVDSLGNVCLTGTTRSTDFPTENPYLVDPADNESDAFVLRLSRLGDSLIFSTYLGGNSGDAARAIALDHSGSIYVAGETWSTDYPTKNPYQVYSGDDSSDVFVTKLPNTGEDLTYSTYLGGGGNDYLYDIAVDNLSCAYITGITHSDDFPLANPYMDSPPGGTTGENWDLFVTKLSSTGDSLVYSTYLGGSSEEFVAGIVVDTFGCAYVSGTDYGLDFPTVNAYQSESAGPSDAFVTKFSNSGSDLIYSTYLGGSGVDGAYFFGATDIALDGAGNVIVAGATASTDFPVLHPYMGTLQGGFDGFIAKLSTTGSSLVYSTYLGGSDLDACHSIAIDPSGYVYVTGWTESLDFPTQSAFQTYLAGSGDLFITKLSQQLSCCQLRGDVDESASVNVADLTYLTDYLFKGGPAPSCFEHGDVDASSAINVADATYLTNYLFKGGPEPLPCL